MRSALRFLMVGAAVAIIGVPNDLATQQAPPDTVFLTQGTRGSVQFSHASHQVMTDCTACHHTSRPEKPLSSPYQACAECHTKAPSAPIVTSIRDAYHDARAKTGTCIGCHVTEAAAGKEVPLKCRECHKRVSG